MGLSIHYNGSFRSAAYLKEMINEVEDIARIYKWRYSVFNTDFPKKSLGNNAHNGEIYGINITPPECETFSLCFLSNGRMSSHVLLKFHGESTNEEEKKYLYMLSVKTQYAGPQIHMILIQLLRYIGQKYLQELNVIDEGEYWETGNENLLIATFKRYNDLLDGFSTALETFPVNDGETIDQYFERLVTYLNNK